MSSHPPAAAPVDHEKHALVIGDLPGLYNFYALIQLGYFVTVAVAGRSRAQSIVEELARMKAASAPSGTYSTSIKAEAFEMKHGYTEDGTRHLASYFASISRPVHLLVIGRTGLTSSNIAALSSTIPTQSPSSPSLNSSASSNSLRTFPGSFGAHSSDSNLASASSLFRSGSIPAVPAAVRSPGLRSISISSEEASDDDSVPDSAPSPNRRTIAISDSSESSSSVAFSSSSPSRSIIAIGISSAVSSEAISTSIPIHHTSPSLGANEISSDAAAQLGAGSSAEISDSIQEAPSPIPSSSAVPVAAASLPSYSANTSVPVTFGSPLPSYTFPTVLPSAAAAASSSPTLRSTAVPVMQALPTVPISSSIASQFTQPSAPTWTPLDEYLWTFSTVSILMEIVQHSSPARIVFLCSRIHSKGEPNFDELLIQISSPVNKVVPTRIIPPSRGMEQAPSSPHFHNMGIGSPQTMSRQPSYPLMPVEHTYPVAIDSGAVFPPPANVPPVVPFVRPALEPSIMSHASPVFMSHVPVLAASSAIPPSAALPSLHMRVPPPPALSEDINSLSGRRRSSTTGSFFSKLFRRRASKSVPSPSSAASSSGMMSPFASNVRGRSISEFSALQGNVAADAGRVPTAPSPRNRLLSPGFPASSASAAAATDQILMDQHQLQLQQMQDLSSIATGDLLQNRLMRKLKPAMSAGDSWKARKPSLRQSELFRVFFARQLAKKLSKDRDGREVHIFLVEDGYNEGKRGISEFKDKIMSRIRSPSISRSADYSPKLRSVSSSLALGAEESSCVTALAMAASIDLKLFEYSEEHPSPFQGQAVYIQPHSVLSVSKINELSPATQCSINADTKQLVMKKVAIADNVKAAAMMKNIDREDADGREADGEEAEAEAEEAGGPISLSESADADEFSNMTYSRGGLGAMASPSLRGIGSSFNGVAVPNNWMVAAVIHTCVACDTKQSTVGASAERLQVISQSMTGLEVEEARTPFSASTEEDAASF